MRTPPAIAAVLLLAASTAAHNGEVPPPPSAGSSPSGIPGGTIGGGRRQFPTKTSSSVATVQQWWLHSRDFFLEIRARRQAARAAARGESTPGETPAAPPVRDPATRERGLEALRAAARSTEVPLAVNALVALGAARDTASLPMLVEMADDPSLDVRIRWTAIFALGLLGDHLVDGRAHLRSIVLDPTRREEERAFPCFGAALAPDRWILPTLAGLAKVRETRRDVPAVALFALGVMRDPLALSEMAPLTSGAAAERDPDWIFRATGAAAIGMVGAPEGVPPLMRALSDDIVAVRRQAVLSLGALLTPADGTALSAVARFLRTERDATTRSYAAISLAESGWPGAEAPLTDLLVNGDTLERSFAAVALGVLVRTSKDDALAARVRPLLRRRLGEASADEARRSLVLAVALSGDRTAAPVIRRMATEACDPPTMCSYVVAFGLLGDRDARPLLFDILRDQNYIYLREDAGRALGMLGDETSIGILAGILGGHETDYLRGSAALALGYIVEPDEAGPLVRALADTRETPSVRALCAKALGRVFDRGTLPFFSHLTRHLDPLVSVECLGLLLRLL